MCASVGLNKQSYNASQYWKSDTLLRRKANSVTHVGTHTVALMSPVTSLPLGMLILELSLLRAKGMRPLIKPSAAVSLDLQSSRQALQIEGSREPEPAGSSNCGRTWIDDTRQDNVHSYAKDQLLMSHSCCSTISTFVSDDSRSE